MKLFVNNRIVSLFMMIAMSIASSYAFVSIQKTNGKTYVFDYSKKIVYNEQETTPLEITTSDFEIQKTSVVKDVIKEVLSEDRLKCLKKEKMAFMFECNVKGYIINIKYIFTKDPFLTVSEIDRIESLLRNYKFIVNTNLEDDKNIRFSIPCFFSNL